MTLDELSSTAEDPHVKDASSDPYFFLKKINLVEKSAVFLVYGLLSFYVLCTIDRRNLSPSAYVTIFLFFMAEGMNIGFYLMELFSNITDDNEKLFYQIPILISQCMLMQILFYYTYEIKVVLLKVKCETPEEYQWGHLKAKTVLVIAYITLVLSYLLEMYEKIVINAQNEQTEYNTTWLKILVVVNRIYSLGTDIPFIYFQWLYLIQFLRLKNEQSPIFRSCKSATAIAWVFLILVMNTLNSIIYNSAYIVIRFVELPATERVDLDSLLIIFSTFNTDVLIFTNGVAFLLLFKRMADSRSFQNPNRSLDS